MKYQSKKQIFSLVFKKGRLVAIISFIFKLFSGLMLPFTAYAFQNLIDDIIASFYRGEKILLLPDHF